MKLRPGFVSNSSSTSFSIYGICLTEDELERFVPEDFTVQEGHRSWQTRGENWLSSKGWEYHQPPNDLYYIGFEWSSIGEDETKREFKARVETALGKDFPGEKCSSHSEGWFDG